MILETALMCMAANIYFEAKNESKLGQFAVAQVVMNRMYDHRYPNTVCDVVKQGLTYKNGKVVLGKCQFSWYCDGRSDEATEQDAWEESISIAFKILENQRYRGITEGATHYHTTFVDPYWAPTLQQVGTIG